MCAKVSYYEKSRAGHPDFDGLLANITADNILPIPARQPGNGHTAARLKINVETAD